jgi:hypothetical protein
VAVEHRTHDFQDNNALRPDQRDSRANVPQSRPEVAAHLRLRHLFFTVRMYRIPHTLLCLYCQETSYFGLADGGCGGCRSLVCNCDRPKSTT